MAMNSKICIVVLLNAIFSSLLITKRIVSENNEIVNCNETLEGCFIGQNLDSIPLFTRIIGKNLNGILNEIIKRIEANPANLKISLQSINTFSEGFEIRGYFKDQDPTKINVSACQKCYKVLEDIASLYCIMFYCRSFMFNCREFFQKYIKIYPHNSKNYAFTFTDFYNSEYLFINFNNGEPVFHRLILIKNNGVDNYIIDNLMQFTFKDINPRVCTFYLRDIEDIYHVREDGQHLALRSIIF